MVYPENLHTNGGCSIATCDCPRVPQKSQNPHHRLQLRSARRNQAINTPCVQLEFQDPKMEVLYHFMGIFPYIGLKNRPYIW